MLKKTITFTDFDGKQQTETHYFNLSKAELVEMELSSDGDGFAETLQKIVKAENGREIIRYFKEILHKSYGIRSEDGKRFIKSDKISEEFSQTMAYDALFVELATDATKSAEFMNGVVPSGMQQEVVGEVETAELPQREPGANLTTEKDLSEMSHEELLAYMRERGIQR